jgi:hypothetical protein
LQRLFVDVVPADRVRRADPEAALAFVARTVTGSAVHRVMTVGVVPDGLTWKDWYRETAAMALAYLTGPSPESGR